MRQLTDPDRLERFMRALGRAARRPTNVYLTGGATAVLVGWRSTTVDVDLKFSPESDELLRVIPRLKEELQINVELASPDQFLPELPGWRERSLFVARHGELTFLHYDAYAQALAKLERAHRQDIADVSAMCERGLITAHQLLEHLASIEPLLYRYPAVDPPAFRRRVEEFVRSQKAD